MKLTKQQRADLVGDAHTYGGALTFAVGLGWGVGPWAGLAAFGAFLAWLGLFWRGGKT